MGDAIKLLLEWHPWLAWPLGLFPLVVTVVAAIWTLWTFGSTFQIQARKPFLERQLDFTVEAAQATAQLASTTDHPKFLAASSRFWELYWGQLALVEDDDLEAAMFDFGENLKAYSFGADRTELQRLSLAVAIAGRRLVVTSWRPGLNPLRKDDRSR